MTVDVILVKADHSVQSILDELDVLLDRSPEGFVIFTRNDTAPVDQRVREIIENNPTVDVWFDDPAADFLEWPPMIDFVAPVSYFNMPTPGSIHSISSVSLRCMLVRKAILMRYGFIDRRFLSIDGAVKEWVLRLIYKGILFQYASLIEPASSLERGVIPLEDQFRFVKFRSGQKWLLWSLWRSWAVGLATLGEVMNSFGKLRKEAVPKALEPRDHSAWQRGASENGRVTVLIPTVERYPYLETVLNQLEEQTVMPYEVIVIDQTPASERKPELFQSRGKIGLKYFTMDRAGQCTSRNFGLQQSSGDFILFIDDDVEFKSDLIERHLRCLRYFQADVSCGVCDEVGAGPIPRDYTFVRLSDVFPTNNGMVRRSVLEKSGLFDLAYDRGQRADGDLGARIYKTGARMVLNPDIRLLHHHAPRGGLRKHKVRRVTMASSRQFITHFRLPHITELYFSRIHCTPRQDKEYYWLTMLGTFSVRGGMLRKFLKVFYAFIMLPTNLAKMSGRRKAAEKMLSSFPQIPKLS